MYIVLNILNQMLNAIVYGLLILFLLNPKYSRIKAMSIYLLCAFIVVLFKFGFYYNITIRLSTAVISQTILYLFILIAFNGSLFTKMLTCILTIITAVLSEYVALFINNSLFKANNAFHPDSKEFFIVTTIALFSQIIITILIIFICKTISYKESPSSMLYFTLLPYIMLYLFATIFAPFIFGGTALNSALISICIMIALISCIILFYYILRHNEKKNIEKAYEELQKLYAMDLEYYRELESRHEELAKLRHDYQNQLATLYMLISSGKTEAAKEFTIALKTELQKYKIPYQSIKK